MNLEDLKQRWEDQDRKLDATLKLNRQLLQMATLGKAETALRRLAFLLGIELLLDLPIALWLGSFIVDHRHEIRFLLPAVVLHLFVIGLIVTIVRQLAAIGSLDYGAPVLEIQRRLESLRIERLRATKWTLLLSPLLWTPLVIVAFESLLGVDVYARFDMSWLLGNLLFGAALIPLAVWISRRYAARMERSPFVQRLMRDLAGYNLNAAAGFVDRLARFAEE
ncbi:MAG TPA: hypothetical protein VF173_26190 [Thermoanaerobaculia bacterium]|nr:hypothetical protein [Thermoanaerobaculia bacterium]